jgi:hypothetical protein
VRIGDLRLAAKRRVTFLSHFFDFGECGLACDE